MKDTITIKITIEGDLTALQNVYAVLANDKRRSELADFIRQAAENYFPSEVFVKADIKPKTLPGLSGERAGRGVTPIVRFNVVTHRYELVEFDPQMNDGHGGLVREPIRVDSTNWQWWLVQEFNKSFQYESDAGSFRAKKETRGTSHRWIARQHVMGEIRKVHMGKSENLTGRTLWETAHKLSQNKLL